MQVGLLRERAGDDDALALATGELIDVPVPEIPARSAFHRGAHDREIARAFRLEQAEVRRPAHEHALERGEALGKRGGLRDYGDAARAILVLQGRDVGSCRAVPRRAMTSSMPVMARSSVVLPQPFGPEERDQFAALDIEVDTVEDRPRGISGVEAADGEHHRAAPRGCARGGVAGRTARPRRP